MRKNYHIHFEFKPLMINNNKKNTNLITERF